MILGLHKRNVNLPKYLENPRDYLVFFLALFSGILIWALSTLTTRQQEPWDSETPYYFVSLFVSGVIFGAIKPVRFHRWVVAIFIGQLIALVFVGMGPLIIIGVVSLAGLSLIPLAGAALSASIISGKNNERD